MHRPEKKDRGDTNGVKQLLDREHSVCIMGTASQGGRSISENTGMRPVFLVFATLWSSFRLRYWRSSKWDLYFARAAN